MITSAEEFANLCASTNSNDLQRTLSDAAPLDVWEKILQKYPSLCLDVAQNRTISEEVFFLLAKSSDGSVRSLIAEKGKLPSASFHIFADDSDERAHRAIAAHRKTSSDI